MNTTTDTTEVTLRNAAELLGHLRTMQTDALRRLEEFGTFADGIEVALEGNDASCMPERLAAIMATAGWLEQLNDQMESLLHVHTGSSDHSHYRSARQVALRLATGTEY